MNDEHDELVPAQITFDEFMKVDIRAGWIESAERVPKSDKLLKLQVDFGPVIGKRQVVAGIGMNYSPETVVDRPATFVINLAPRKLMGIESHGMILAGQNNPEKTGITVAFLGQEIAAGARIG